MTNKLNSIKNLFVKKPYKGVIVFSVLILFLASRLYNILGAIPLFNDEADYIGWAQHVNANYHNAFISIASDGKQPSFIWLVAACMRIISNPLLAGRIASVIAGLATMVGIYFLTNELFKNKRVALIASLIYVIYPFSLLYDRLALYDSLVATTAVWSLYFEICLIRRRKLTYAILAGIAIGGGLLTKSSSAFYLLLLPFSLLLFDIKDKQRVSKFIKWLGLAVVTGVVAYSIESILRLSSYYSKIAIKNSQFVLTIPQWIKHPFIYASSNFHALLSYVVGFSTLPFLVLVVLSFFIDKKFLREKLLLLAWSIIPYTALMFFGGLIYPRYILFMMMPLLVLCAYTVGVVIQKIKPQYVGILIGIILFIPMLYKDYFIINNFASSPIPAIEHWQYVNSFYSGGGINPVVKILRQQSKSQKIYVTTLDSFGLTQSGIDIYLVKDKQVNYQQVALAPSPQIPPVLLNDAKRAPTYFVSVGPLLTTNSGVTSVEPRGWPVKTIYVYRNHDKSILYLDQVTP